MFSDGTQVDWRINAPNVHAVQDRSPSYSNAYSVAKNFSRNILKYVSARRMAGHRCVIDSICAS